MKNYTKESYKSGGFQVKERIYVLKNPSNNEVFYIGRTKKPLTDRLSGHIAAAKGKSEKFRNGIKDEYIMRLLAEGSRPIIEAIEVITPISYIEYLELAEREIYWMKWFRDNGSAIFNVMGIKIVQPNAKYLWYLDCKDRGDVPIEYYYCGEDSEGNKLYDTARMRSDKPKKEPQLQIIGCDSYNPFDNPIWKRKMGLIS